LNDSELILGLTAGEIPRTSMPLPDRQIGRAYARRMKASGRANDALRKDVIERRRRTTSPAATIGVD